MAAILVVVAGLGVSGVVHGPRLATQLGLAGTTSSVTTEPPPAPGRYTPALRPVGAEAPVPTSRGLTGALAPVVASPVLGKLTGSVVDPATKTVLWQQGAAEGMVPASTGKMLTAAAVLLAVDHDARLDTTVVAGSEPGTVVLVGGGDPTLSAGKESVYPGAAKLDDLVAQVKANAEGPVKKVVVDVGRYAGPALAPAWLPADIPGGFIAPIVPVMLDGARSNPTDGESPRSGTPAQAAAQELAARLGAAAAGVGTAAQGAKVLGKVSSPTVEQLAQTTLLISDNVLAEALARQVAIATGNEPSFAGGAKATLEVLAKNGLDVTGIRMADGSGLSTEDSVSARLLTDILTAAAAADGTDPRTAKLRPLLSGLPVAGGSGTLAKRYGDPDSLAGRGWVRAKTGTLSGVNSLAGVVTDNDGRLLVFSFISNGSQGSNVARPALDAIAAVLRGCGCR